MSTGIPHLFLLRAYEYPHYELSSLASRECEKLGFFSLVATLDFKLCLFVSAVETSKGLIQYSGEYDYPLEIILGNNSLRELVDRGLINVDYFGGSQDYWKEIVGLDTNTFHVDLEAE